MVLFTRRGPRPPKLSLQIYKNYFSFPKLFSFPMLKMLQISPTSWKTNGIVFVVFICYLLLIFWVQFALSCLKTSTHPHSLHLTPVVFWEFSLNQTNSKILAKKNGCDHLCTHTPLHAPMGGTLYMFHHARSSTITLILYFQVEEFRPPWFKSWVWLPSCGTSIKFLTYICLSFPFCKSKMIIIPTPTEKFYLI